MVCSLFIITVVGVIDMQARLVVGPCDAPLRKKVHLHWDSQVMVMLFCCCPAILLDIWAIFCNITWLFGIKDYFKFPTWALHFFGWNFSLSPSLQLHCCLLSLPSSKYYRKNVLEESTGQLLSRAGPHGSEVTLWKYDRVTRVQCSGSSFELTDSSCCWSSDVRSETTEELKFWQWGAHPWPFWEVCMWRSKCYGDLGFLDARLPNPGPVGQEPVW